MSLEDLQTYKLNRLSTRICRHCDHFRTAQCSQAPVAGTKAFRRFNWSSLSVCDDWTPNPRTDEAMQILTWRKLEGHDVEDFRGREDIEPTVMDDEQNVFQRCIYRT